MKRSSLIISLVSIILVLASLVMLGITFGWTADIIDIGPNTISVGDLRYSETGAFISNDSLIYPGSELISEAITVTDESPIDSQLRVSITYTKISDSLTYTDISFDSASKTITSSTFDLSTFSAGDELVVTGSTSNDGLYTVTGTPTTTTLVVEESLLDESAGASIKIAPQVYYANGVDDHLDVTFDPAFVYDTNYWYYGGTSSTITAGAGLINIISSLNYDGELVGNDYAGHDVYVTVTIQVKQNDNVTWATLSTYDFSTGYQT